MNKSCLNCNFADWSMKYEAGGEDYGMCFAKIPGCLAEYLFDTASREDIANAFEICEQRPVENCETWILKEEWMNKSCSSCFHFDVDDDRCRYPMSLIENPLPKWLVPLVDGEGFIDNPGAKEECFTWRAKTKPKRGQG